MAILKANAYGHGLSEIGNAVVEAGTDWIGVARIEEGIQLRRSGICKPILVLGYVQPEAIPQAIDHEISVALFDLACAEEYHRQSIKLKNILKVHIKLDTGMGRLGVIPESAQPFLKEVISFSGLKIEGIFTHFARADEPHVPETNEQIIKFNHALSETKILSLNSVLIHASNSAGTLAYPEARYDMVRPGLALYGYSPDHSISLLDRMSPALKWKTRLTSIKKLPKGQGISYGHEYFTTKEENIGVIAAGYADGFQRCQGNQVLIKGQKVPVIGRVCMDQAMISLEKISDPGIGDEVVLLGTQGNQEISAQDLADLWDINQYNVLSTISNRVERIYLD